MSHLHLSPWDDGPVCEDVLSDAVLAVDYAHVGSA